MNDRFLAPQALKAGSVTGLFTLESLCSALKLPQGDVARRDVVWRTLSPVADEKIDQDGTYCWQLDPAARRAALNQFFSPRTLRDFMEYDAPQDPGDPLTRALREVLTMDRISFDDPGTKADIDALQQALSRAAALLDAAEFAKDVPALATATRQVRKTDRMAYRTMTIRELSRFASAQIKELQARTDLRVVMPGRHFGFTPQRDKISHHAKGRSENAKPLLLTGIGGAGKSALLSSLMLAWQRSKPDLIQVLLDFDRRQLALGEPVEILQELFRQITAHLQLQSPDGNDALLDGLSSLRRDIALYKVDESGNRHSNFDQLSRVLHELDKLDEDWARPLADMSMVVILDTFEAIDRLAVVERQFPDDAPERAMGNEVVSQIMDLLSVLQFNHLPGMRVIVSGREEPLTEAELDRWFGDRVHLKGLYPPSGAKLLRAELQRLNPANTTLFHDEAKARTVCRLLAGHPLAIIAFAKYADGNPRDVDGLIAELEAEGGFAAEFAQIFLYTRILNRITDPRVRPLAHPGLMLRIIDPEIILNVLAGPCLDRGATSEDPLALSEAEELLMRLRNQYWLVDPVPGELDKVRHIPDLRRLMLPGLLAGPGATDTGDTRARKQDLRDRALEVCATAAAFFKTRNTGDDPLDALYYGAFISDPPDEFPVDLADRLDRHLGSDLVTLPVTWRAVIRHLRGLDLSPAERAALPDRYRAADSRRVMDTVQQTGTQIFTKGMAEELSDLINTPIPEAGDAPALAEPARDQRPATASLLEQSYELRRSWDKAAVSAPDVAQEFLRNCLIEAGSPDFSKDLIGLEDDVRRDPFGNALYIAVLLRCTDHMPWTPGVAPAEIHSAGYSDGFSGLLSAAIAAEYMDFETVGAALGTYLATVDRKNPVATNRRSPVIPRALGSRDDQADKTGGQLAANGLSLAAGQPADIDRLARRDSDTGMLIDAPYRAALAPLWHEYRQRTLTLSVLERFYRLDETWPIEVADITDMSSFQLRHYVTMLRGLNPELYPPAISLLAELDSHVAQEVISGPIESAALWPLDLRFDEKSPYRATDASVVVETADRCGVLRALLERLSDHKPFAGRLVSMYDLVTDLHFPELKDLLIDTPA